MSVCKSPIKSYNSGKTIGLRKKELATRGERGGWHVLRLEFDFYPAGLCGEFSCGPARADFAVSDSRISSDPVFGRIMEFGNQGAHGTSGSAEYADGDYCILRRHCDYSGPVWLRWGLFPSDSFYPADSTRMQNPVTGTAGPDRGGHGLHFPKKRNGLDREIQLLRAE